MISVLGHDSALSSYTGLGTTPRERELAKDTKEREIAIAKERMKVNAALSILDAEEEIGKSIKKNKNYSIQITNMRKFQQ